MERSLLVLRTRCKGHFPLGGINSRAERHFLLFKDRLAESERQKKKENVIPRGKFRLVDTTLRAIFHWAEFSARNAPVGLSTKENVATRGKVRLVENGLHDTLVRRAERLCGGECPKGDSLE